MDPVEPVKILLVDDQPAKLLSYEVILGPLKETLLTASSAREALDLLLRNDVAVVLIDVQMPELDGFELAEMIRGHPRFQELALIFVSAIHLSDLDRLRGYAAGAVDYVSVPVVAEVLRAKVRVFVDLHRKTRELERLNRDLEQRVLERTADLEASRADLVRLNAELEERIEQRTRERESALAQLFEAQKSDSIGQLTGGVAHDFNNLLMAMFASLRLLRKRVKNDEMCIQLVDNAISAAERGTALTQRLLAFARRQELSPTSVSIAKLLAGMKVLLDGALGPNIELVNRIPDDLPCALVDSNQLELAILNLALNARDAMPQGGRFELTAEMANGVDESAPPELKPGRYVHVMLKDTGEGMSEEVLARAAEPFFTTKGPGKGTGLGLSMVSGLAAQSGGAFRLTSKPGRGARIDLWFPQALDTGEAAAESAPSEDAVRGDRTHHILLVDDDPLVINGTMAMIEDLGHSVIAARSGQEALDIMERDGRFDLVITDQIMPGMTGTELAKRLRIKWPELKVILASGYTDLKGANDGGLELPRLPKPFLQEDLSRIIAAVIDGRSARASSAQARGANAFN